MQEQQRKGNVNSQIPGKTPIAEVVSKPAPSAAGPPRLLERIKPGFDLAGVRCWVEAGVHKRISENEDLLNRIKALSQEASDARLQMRLGLMTDGYRVDEAITPKLHRLGSTLTGILRLTQPLDMFVQPSDERNAFCLPSRKRNRLVMCLNAGLLAALTNQELLFVMGHEVGHALLRHGELPGISFDHPDFSPLEVIQLRALDRAQELSCDRFGLLACQDVRVASTALFKLASGLTERWIAFDELAYSRHFDELSSMAEVVNLEDATRSHPLVPLRVKALIAFARSETYAEAFGKSGDLISRHEVESGVEAMLSVLQPDLSELQGAVEEQALNRFLFDGALLVIGADGVVDPAEVAWLGSLCEKKWSVEELAELLSTQEFRQQMLHRLEENAHILRNKLPERKRAGLLQVMCQVALSAGGIPEAEFEVLEHLRQLLRIRSEFAQGVLHQAQQEMEQEQPSESASASEQGSLPAAPVSAPRPSSADPLEQVLEDAKLPAASLQSARAVSEQIREQNHPVDLELRSLVAWAITASRKGGPLTKAAGKRIAISAVRVCRAKLQEAGMGLKGRSAPVEQRIREAGVVSLFQKGERVTRDSDPHTYIVVSVSRARERVLIAPESNLESTLTVDPQQLSKDPLQGAWPPELTMTRQ